jgi:gas vesicle protein
VYVLNSSVLTGVTTCGTVGGIARRQSFHCPDTSKEIREELERLARRHRNLTGSARELYQKQQVTYSNGIVSADPVAALERAREARDATREAWDRMQEVSGRNARAAGSGPTASSGPAAVDPPETSTQIAFVEVD